MTAMSRRAFSVWAPILGALGFARAAQAEPTPGPESLGVSNGAAAIHQEVEFGASAARIYHALTDPKLFEELVILSGAMQSMALASAPTQITDQPGAAFSLFGGYITGRNVELEPDKRIVQAWRAGSWPPHIYSIASFELIDHPGGCRLVFDHRGFPSEAADSLAKGWQAHYWAPLAKVVV
jgi:activator of HSP90 ATPase